MYKNIYQNNQNDIMVSSKKTKLFKKMKLSTMKKKKLAIYFLF